MLDTRRLYAFVAVLIIAAVGFVLLNQSSGETKKPASTSMVVAGHVGIGAPLTGAKVTVVNADGTVVSKRPATTSASGSYEVSVPRADAALEVVVTGGEAGGKLFGGTLRATTATAAGIVDVNEVTTLAAAYRDRHPKVTPAKAERAVKRYLGIPAGLHIAAPLLVESSVFNHGAFLDEAATVGFNPYVKQLAADVGGNASKPFPGEAANGFDPATSFATAFVEEFGKQYAGLVFKNLFGDPTMDKLNQISAQLDAMGTRFTDMEAQLTGAIYSTAFSARIAGTNTARSNVRTIFNNLKDVAETAVDVKAKQTAFDAAVPAKKAAAEKALNAAKEQATEARAEFESSFNAYRGNALVNDFHLELYSEVAPELAVTLPISYGKALMANKRFLTTADSKAQQDLYRYFEDFQALAARLAVEYKLAKGRTDTGKPAAEFKTFRAQQLSQMPKQLPDEVVLDRGSYADPSKATISSTNKMMLLNKSTVYGHWPVTEALPDSFKLYNDPAWRLYNGGFSDWRAPTTAELQYVLSERRGAPIVPFLQSIGLKHFILPSSGSRAFIWTASTRPFEIRIMRSLADAGEPRRWGIDTLRGREGVSTIDASVAAYPSYKNGPWLPEQLQGLRDQYLEFWSVTIPVRSSGSTRYF